MKRTSGLILVSIVLAIVLVAVVTTQGQDTENTKETVVFIGQPTHKVSEGGFERMPEILNESKATASICVVVRIGDDFFWKSRQNKPMFKVVSGAYTYYVAPSSGYVKIMDTEIRQLIKSPNFKEIIDKMGNNPTVKAILEQISPTEEKFGYTEHMSIGLRSVTYWGNQYSIEE